MKKGYWPVILRYLLAVLHESIERCIFVVLNTPFVPIAHPFLFLRISAITLIPIFGMLWYYDRVTISINMFREPFGLIIGGIFLVPILLGLSTRNKSSWKIGRSRIARLEERRSALMQELKLLAGHREDTGSGKSG
jgi:hypothetical protein